MCTSVNHHCIALHYMFWPLQLKLQSFDEAFQYNLKTYFGRYRVTTDIYMHYFSLTASAPNCMFFSLWAQ